MYMHTYIHAYSFLYMSLHVHSTASGYVAQCCQLQHVTLNQVYPKWPPPLQKNNQAYA